MLLKCSNPTNWYIRGKRSVKAFYCTNKETYEGQPALEWYWYDIDREHNSMNKLAQRVSVAKKSISVITHLIQTLIEKKQCFKLLHLKYEKKDNCHSSHQTCDTCGQIPENIKLGCRQRAVWEFSHFFISGVRSLETTSTAWQKVEEHIRATSSYFWNPSHSSLTYHIWKGCFHDVSVLPLSSVQGLAGGRG